MPTGLDPEPRDRVAESGRIHGEDLVDQDAGPLVSFLASVSRSLPDVPATGTVVRDDVAA